MGLFSPLRPFTEAELDWLEAYTTEAYERFTEVVAEGRRLSREAVEQVARGRVWTGPQARDRGLVDGIGTFSEVVEAARELSGIPAARPHEIVWSAPRGGLLQVARRLTGSAAATLPPELESLIEPFLLSRSHGALYYLPLAWH